MSQSNKKAKSSQQQERRERTEAMRAEREAAARRAERRTRLLIAVAVIAAVALVGVALATRSATTGENAAVPQGVAAPDGPVVEGDGDVVLTEWLDFQCPACKTFHDRLGDTVAGLVEDGEITFEVNPLSFINAGSERAANAYGCAVDADAARTYYDQLFINQGPEAEGGYTDEQLIALAEPAGIAEDQLGAFTSCVEDGTYDGWVTNVEIKGTDAGVFSTPTFLIDGEEADITDAESLQEAIEAARG